MKTDPNLTLARLLGEGSPVPVGTAWVLSELGEAKGRQELFTKQSPQKLKTLREHALIESAVSSNRIEGVEVDQGRIATVVLGKKLLKDRDETEVRGYRQALDLIHTQSLKRFLNQKTIREFHRLARGGMGDAGRYKARDGDIIERRPDGRVRVRFRPVSAARTPDAMGALTAAWAETQEAGAWPTMLSMAIYNLDFLCIHPFRDGNGRVSRLLLLLQAYLQGYEVGRYISLERLIEQNKTRYYETLEESSKGWHEGKNNPWPYINYILFIFREAYKEFESRLGNLAGPRGAKTDIIRTAVSGFRKDFRLIDLERACPGVSRDMIRKVLAGMRKQGLIQSLGRGPGAPWRNIR